MAYGAHLAGKVINITRTTAPHAISHPLTSFFGIPHGHAAGLTLSSFLVYNFNVTDIEKGFNPERVKNNPRKLTEDALRATLHSIY